MHLFIDISWKLNDVNFSLHAFIFHVEIYIDTLKHLYNIREQNIFYECNHSGTIGIFIFVCFMLH